MKIKKEFGLIAKDEKIEHLNFLSKTKNNLKKTGFTLIESLLALSLVSGSIVYGVDYTLKSLEEAKYKQHANLPLQIIKAIDRRIEVDGYSSDLWTGLPTSSNTEDMLNYSKNAFIAKGNLNCGLSTGWVPQLSDASTLELIPCNLGQDKYTIYDYQLLTSNNIDGYISSQDIIMRLNSNIDIKEDDIFLKHKQLLTKIKSGQPTLKMGNFQAGFSDFNDLTKDISNKECIALENNCVIKVSWESDGYTESLRLDGTNNMINDTISFSDTYYSDNKQCLLWSYDGDLDGDGEEEYTLEPNTVNCGIGIYNKTQTPLIATVDAVVDSVTPMRPIVLDQVCNTYTRDSSGYLIANGTTECGLFQDNYTDPSNPSNKIIQVVENFQVDANKDSTLDRTMFVEDLVVGTLKTTTLDIIENLVVNGSTKLNILYVKDGTVSEFNDAVTMKILDVLSKTHFKSDVTITDNTVSGESTNNGLSVTGDVNIDLLTLNNVPNNVDNDVNVQNGTTSANLQLLTDSNIWNGANCGADELSHMAFDGKNVLVCRTISLPSQPTKYKWLSNRQGEVLAFNGSCPDGWTSFNDADGRTLLGNGKVFEPTLNTADKTIDYQTGDKGGQAFVKLTEAQLPSHQHDFRDAYFSEHWGDRGNAGMWGDNGGADKDNSEYTRDAITDPVGGDQAHENRMPYYVVNYCMYQEGDKANEVHADPSFNPDDYWYPYADEYSDWYTVGQAYDCSADYYSVIDDLDPVTNLPTGTQTEYWERRCTIDTQRAIKGREINYLTGEIRYTGVVDFENDTEKYSEIWTRGTPVYGPWYDIGEPYDCSSTPVSIIKSGGYYNVTLTCKVLREQVYQERLVRKDSDGNVIEYRDYEDPKTQQQIFTDNYLFQEPVSTSSKTCSDWAITATENAKLWSPDAANYDRGTTVNQSRTVTEYRNCEYRVTIIDKTYLVEETKETRSTYQTRTISGGKVNLNNWRTYDSRGSWSVQGGGTYVLQSINGESTIFESGTSDYGAAPGAVMRGQIKVRSGAGDDDWIGFVMGKRSTNDFYLWSWKKGDQGAAQMGHVFAKVTDRNSLLSWNMHTSASGYEVKGKHITGSLSAGWVHGKTYTFRIEYRPNNVTLFIDDKLLFDIDGSYPEGSIGFFNKSQSHVEYFNVSEEPYFE